MTKSRAVLALAAVAALASASARAGDRNPFLPPESASALDEGRVREIVRQMVDEAVRADPGLPLPSAAAGAAGGADDTLARAPDPTLDADLVACVGGRALWRERAGGSLPGPAPGAGRGLPQAAQPQVAANQDVKFGVTFYATPRPPLRDPCAD